MNKMQEIRIEKVTLNIGTGGPGESLDKAVKLLQNLTEMKPILTKTKKRIPGWGIRPGLHIGCKVTLRKKKAEDFFKRLITAKSKKLAISNFDTNGNFSFGVSEYLDIPGAEYDMTVGIIGLEAAITLSRAGARISRRRIRPRKLQKKQRVSREEAISFIRQKYLVEVEE